MDKTIYNNEPVFYCKHCLSLKIKTAVKGLNLDYCDDCGATSVATTNIFDWERMYEKRHGFKYINKK